MNVIQKQRVKFTVSATITAAVFLLVLVGGLFGIVFATNDVFITRHLDRALEDPRSYSEDAPQDMQCIFIYRNGNNVLHFYENADYYEGDFEKIIYGAISTKDGKYNVGDKYFIVKSTPFEGGILYAVIDRTSSHDQFVNTAVMVTLLYCLSIVLVAILAMLSSTRLLYPVALAMKKQRDFVANTSHELKTPLTIISSNISVIKSTPSSTIQENDEWITSIQTQVVRMQDLITNMLELSKLEQSELPKSEVDFSSIVEGACFSFDAVCFERNVTLIEDIVPNIKIMGEHKSLERLIITLLDNAVKYCGEKGKIGVFLTTEQNKAHLAILNTGESISKEDCEHIFDRFYRTDGARANEDKQSFGLGLAIAQATVKNHNGTISCHGVENKGTVFDVYIPLFKARKSLSSSQKSLPKPKKNNQDHN